MIEPAAINTSTILRSSFGRLETEGLAMYIAAYLAKGRNPWKTEIVYPDFVVWVATARNLNWLYTDTVDMMGVHAFVDAGLRDFIRDGHVDYEERGNTSFFTVSDSFVEMMDWFFTRR